ncbi:MAG: rhodanese-like domain-containing protein [Verrucomicrobiales bacterium]
MKSFKILTVTFAVLFAIGGSVAQAADAKEKLPAAADTKKVSTYKNIGVEYFDKLRSSKTNIVLDVRTRKEFEEGHIPGAILIDFRSADFEKQIQKLDPNKTYLVHCAVGGRSAQACEKLEKIRFANVYNLEGGFKAWEKEGKAVEKGAGNLPAK